MNFALTITRLGIYLFFCPYLFAIDNIRLPDTRAAGMGGNEVTQSVWFNPALISLSNHKTLKFDYYNRYQINELLTFNGSFCFPNPILSTGLHVSSFGYESYRENMFRILVGKQLSNKWNVGIAFQYKFLQTDLWEKPLLTVSTDIGVYYLPVDNLLIGVLIMDSPSFQVKNEISDNKIFNDYFIQIGFQWKAINDLLITATLEKIKNDNLIGHVGIEYTPFNSFFVRMGLKGHSFSPSFGIGYSFHAFTLDVSTIHHSDLGMSMGLGISYSF